MVPDGLKAVVILRPMLLEVVGEVQQRTLEGALLAKEERDQEPTDTPVPVEEGMDRLELRVGRGPPLGEEAWEPDRG